MPIILFLFFITNYAFGQIGNKESGFLEYQTYLTKEEVSNLLENFETDTTLKEAGFSLSVNRKNYEIRKDEKLYATIGRVPQNSLFLDNCDEIIPLFELNCIEKKSSLFGILIILENKIEKWKKRAKIIEEN